MADNSSLAESGPIQKLDIKKKDVYLYKKEYPLPRAYRLEEPKEIGFRESRIIPPSLTFTQSNKNPKTV